MNPTLDPRNSKSWDPPACGLMEKEPGKPGTAVSGWGHSTDGECSTFGAKEHSAQDRPSIPEAYRDAHVQETLVVFFRLLIRIAGEAFVRTQVLWEKDKLRKA